MPHTPRSAIGSPEASSRPLPELAELCRIHDLGLELIDRSHDLDQLLDRVLEEYEKRLTEISSDALDLRVEPADEAANRRLKALVMFASQAAALKVRAVETSEIRERADILEEQRSGLESALAEAQTSRKRLDAVLSALTAGIIIVDANGIVVKANRAASLLLGDPAGELSGKPAPGLLLSVPRESEGEVVLERPEGDGRQVYLVARRGLAGEGGSEVVLLSDITEKHREMEERYRLERLDQVLRTLSVLSHKINNPLTALMGRAQILQGYKNVDERVMKSVGVIAESAQRISDLVRELAAVVREGRQEGVEKILDMRAHTPGGRNS